MYIVQKGGMVLAGARALGVKELVLGRLADVETAIWSSRMGDAMGFGSRYEANAAVNRFGGEVLNVPVKATKKEEPENGMDKTDR